MLKLYNYYRSSASYRVRIALNLKKIPYEDIPVNLLQSEQLTEEYKKINPQGLVPALVDNENVITQSLAILAYLDETHPEPPLLPKDSVGKAQVRSIALSIACDIHPLNNLGALNYLKDVLHVTDDQKKEWYRHWIAKGFLALEERLSKSKFVGNYCYGDTPTSADICLVPQIYNARRFHCDLSLYPTLVRIDECCQQHPAFVAAAPKE